jgi:hypothetical protein
MEPEGSLPHKCPPLASTLSQLNPVHPSTSLLFGNNDLVKVIGAESEVVTGECEKCASRCFDISIPAEILRKKQRK